MSIFFSPARKLMDRLHCPAKFGLIGAMALGAIALLFYLLASSLQTLIDSNRRELLGVEMAKPFLKVVQLTQQHRALSAGLLGGASGMGEKRAAKEAEVIAAIQAMDAVDAREGGVLQSSAAWRKVKERWELLRSTGLAMSVGENTAAHTALVAEMLGFLGLINENSGLILDPEFDSYYLMDTAMIRLPDLLERIGQVRALGMGALSGRELSEAGQIDFGARIGIMKKVEDDLLHNLNRSAFYNPALARRFESFAEELGSANGEVLRIVRSDIVQRKFETLPRVYYDKTTATIDIGYRQLNEVLFPTLEELLHARIDRQTSQYRWSLAGALLVILGVVYLTVGLYLGILGGIRSLAEGSGRVAGGDLTAPIVLASQDELRIAADQFNVMIEAVSQLIRNVQTGAAEVSSAAVSLALTSDRVSRGSSQQTDAATGMAAAVQQMTFSVGEITRHADEAQAISNKSGALSTHGQQVVGKTVEEMSAIAEMVNGSALIIRELGKQSEQISSIVNVIREIADQTNLLALNAAIEAARAGEAGRGFAVVADEVRKLAERTGKATKEIGGMIAAVQHGTSDAVASMEAGVARVGQGVLLARQAGDSIGQISAGASQVVVVIGDISTALKEQREASGEIAVNVERIAEMAEKNHATVAEATLTAQKLERLAGTLQGEIGRFRTR
ncbi:MAG: methyl-accepting chemotaxis protein [Rhodocyclaceae bacterium]